MAGTQFYDNPDEIMAKVREGLAGLQQKKTGTTRSLVEGMAGDIRRALAEGHTLADVVGVLSGAGMNIKDSTLRLYLKNAPEGQTKAPKAAKAAGTRKGSRTSNPPEVTPASSRAGKGKAAETQPKPQAPAQPSKGGFAVEPDPERI